MADGSQLSQFKQPSNVPAIACEAHAQQPTFDFGFLHCESSTDIRMVAPSADLIALRALLKNLTLDHVASILPRVLNADALQTRDMQWRALLGAKAIAMQLEGVE